MLVLVESTLILRPLFMGNFLVGFELDRIVAVKRDEDESKPKTDSFEAFAAAYGLNETEQAIVSLMAQGRSRSFIANALSYSEHTIRNYTRTIYQKIGVHSKQELLDKMLAARNSES